MYYSRHTWCYSTVLLELALLQHLGFPREYCLGRHGRVDTAGLDGYDDMSTRLEEVFGIVRNDTCLVRLGDIREDHIDRREKHAVSLRCASILNDGWVRKLVLIVGDA